jgi:hypothetical protein
LFVTTTGPGRCPQCHQLNLLTARTCAFCQTPLATVTQPSKLVAGLDSDGTQLRPVVFHGAAGALILMIVSVLAFKIQQDSRAGDTVAKAASPAVSSAIAADPVKVQPKAKAVQAQLGPSVMQPRMAQASRQSPGELLRVSGEGARRTRTFRVSTPEWAIAWSTRREKSYGDSSFAIIVHDVNGNYVALAANVMDENNDSITMRGAGTYYLNINGKQPYTIVVRERHSPGKLLTAHQKQKTQDSRKLNVVKRNGKREEGKQTT